MIYDKLENLKNYSQIIPNFEIVEREIKKILSTPFEVGRFTTENPNIYYMSSQYLTEEKLYEAHQEDFDIQIVIEGYEKALIGDYKKQFNYDENGNIGNLPCSETASIKLIPDYFAVFFPGEMHCPGLPDQKPANVKKIVFKTK